MKPYEEATAEEFLAGTAVTFPHFSGRVIETRYWPANNRAPEPVVIERSVTGRTERAMTPTQARAYFAALPLDLDAYGFDGELRSA